MKVRVPADVDIADRVFAGLTARQLAILGAHAIVLWVAWVSVGRLVPPFVFGAFAVPVATVGFVWATLKFEGTTLERLATAALAHFRVPRRRVLAPEGIVAAPRWAPRRAAAVAPLEQIFDVPYADGVIDLGEYGHGVVCRASSINFALRSDVEQRALVDAFGRLLNALDAPVEFLIRSDRADLATMIAGLEERAADLAHPALEDAAREHAAFLSALGARRDVLARQVLVCFRDPAAGDAGAAGARLTHRVEEAETLLRGLGIRLRKLSDAEAATLLARASDPESAATTVAPGDFVVEGAR